MKTELRLGHICPINPILDHIKMKSRKEKRKRDSRAGLEERTKHFSGGIKIGIYRGNTAEIVII
jgi:hypothetical protein